MARNGSTADAILDVAQRLIQTRGYNGFSYKDVAQALGIRTASIHYHFPTKADLGVKLVSRYRVRFREELAAIEAGEPVPDRRLIRFSELFRRTFEVGNRLCLCGMLSAEIAILPDQIAAEVEAFFRETETWVAAVLLAGRDGGEMSFAGPPEPQARLLLAMLEGSMVVARGLRDSAYFQAMVESSLAQLRRPEPLPIR